MSPNSDSRTAAPSAASNTALPRKTQYVLACIDGTDSKLWRTPNRYYNGSSGYSHTHEFFQRFDPQQGAKEFFEGPNREGSDRSEILDRVLQFISESLRQLQGGGAVRPALGGATGAADKRGKSPVEIVLVGHSRGGWVAIETARLLRQEMKVGVYFLGLFDAVERSLQSDGGEKIANVLVTRHARRAQSGPSDPLGAGDRSFGNCGTISEGDYVERFFPTSHGGMGGAPELEARKLDFRGVENDPLSGSSRLFGAPRAKALVGFSEPGVAQAAVGLSGINQTKVGGEGLVGHPQREDAAAMQRLVISRQVYRWMEECARDLGLPLSPAHE